MKKEEERKKKEEKDKLKKQQKEERRQQYHKDKHPGATLPPCRGLWGTLIIGDDIDCNTCPHPGVPRVESHLFTVGGFLGNSRGWPGRLRAFRIWAYKIMYDSTRLFDGVDPRGNTARCF